MVTQRKFDGNPKKFQFMILGKTPRQLIIVNVNQIKKRESQKQFYMVLQLING